MIQIQLAQKAEKGLIQAPLQVKNKFAVWIQSLQRDGLLATRKRAGFHDEPLKGKREGERSVRLNKQWRVIYKEVNHVLEIQILEVMPHDY
jgi:proteic killer suppression protein